MKLAQLILEYQTPVVVFGDFNNVCWSKTSKLFRNFSKLKDARINRGFYSTFPAKLWLFRFPLDLFFHSETVIVNKLKTVSPIGSDHLPLVSEFYISSLSESKKQIKSKLQKVAEQKIKEGKEAAKIEN